MNNSNWKKSLSLGLSIFALFLGSAVITGCETAEVEQEGIEEEGIGEEGIGEEGIGEEGIGEEGIGEED